MKHRWKSAAIAAAWFALGSLVTLAWWLYFGIPVNRWYSAKVAMSLQGEAVPIEAFRNAEGCVIVFPNDSSATGPVLIDPRAKVLYFPSRTAWHRLPGLVFTTMENPGGIVYTDRSKLDHDPALKVVGNSYSWTTSDGRQASVTLEHGSA